MARFVLIVECPGDVDELGREACHKIVDDGRLWELLSTAAAEEGPEHQWERFDWGAGVDFAGTTAEFKAKERETA